MKKIAFILNDWESNMLKKDGYFYKRSVVKTMWYVQNLLKKNIEKVLVFQQIH